MAATAVVSLPSCIPPAPVAAGLLPAAIPQGYGRIWIYRLYEPSVSGNNANLDINGRKISLLPYGSLFYGDVRPGNYRVSVENPAAPNDSHDLVVARDQEVFAKIVVADTYLSGGGTQGVHRETFFVRPVAPGQALLEMAPRP